MFELNMGVVSALIVLLISAGIVAVLLRRFQTLRLQRQQLGLEWMRRLKDLLSHMQKHRGLSNAFLNGSESALADIELLQSDIQLDLKGLMVTGEWVANDLRWQNITQHWQKLSDSFSTLPADNNLNQHNQLIQSLLFSIDDVAQRYDLLLLKCPDEIPLHLSWREILPIAECVGQARAVGVGVAVQNHCDSVARIRLNYLRQKIETNTQLLWREIAPDQKQQTSVAVLLECIEHKIIKERPDIDAEDYFALATAALEGLHQQFDAMIRTQQLRLHC